MSCNANDDLYVFRYGDPNLPTKRAVQQRLMDAGHVEGEGALALPAPGSRMAPDSGEAPSR